MVRGGKLVLVAAILLLGEYPSPVEIAGMVLVIAGMSVALRAR